MSRTLMPMKLTYDLIITMARYVGKGNSVVYATHHPKVINALEETREEVYRLRRELKDIEMLAFQVADDIASPTEWKKRGFTKLSDVGKRAFDIYDRIRQLNTNRVIPSIGEERKKKAQQK